MVCMELVTDVNESIVAAHSSGTVLERRASGSVGQKIQRPLRKEDFVYTACYCEENVYRLCQTLVDSGHAREDASDLIVLFISNENRQVPFWRQQASGDTHEAWKNVDCPQCRSTHAGEARRDEENHHCRNGRIIPAHTDAGGAREANGTSGYCGCRGVGEARRWGNEERVRERRGAERCETDGCRDCSEGHTGNACSPIDDGRGLVVWDYHVIALQGNFPQPSSSSPTSVGCSQHDPQRKPLSACDVRVWDLDATLPFPSRLCCYVRHALWAGKDTVPPLLPAYERLFRLIAAPHFLRLFASDRSHMRKDDSPHCQWLAPPPAYPPIVASDGCTCRLQRYIQMSPATAATTAAIVAGKRERRQVWREVEGEEYGVVVDEQALTALFGLQPHCS